MSRAPLRPTTSSRGGDPTAEDAETITTDDREGTHETVRALYVTGPNGGVRHVLPEGVVSLGRGADVTITVNDPRVSRSHAALHVGTEMTLGDRGSANGTFLGEKRIEFGEPQSLAEGQTFFIGDSALVVRSCTLRRIGEKLLSNLDEAKERLRGSPLSSSPMVVLRLRASKSGQRWIKEAVLGGLLVSERDFVLRLDNEKLILGIEARGESDVGRLERAALEALVGWSIAADVRGQLVTSADVERAGDGLRSFLASDAPLSLARGKLVLRDPVMKTLEQTIVRVAPTTVNVLILGETGAGKDVVAAMLHELSTRADKPFIGLNCASLPESLLESELFGYERGAFTGAVAPKPGLLEASESGTLFLDEIGDLPLALQAKLLRVIESHEVTRLGAVKPRSVDVRFVAATNHDLARDVSAGRFRQDLFYRLNSVTLTVPPLRDRSAEIEPLAQLFLESARARFETAEILFSPAALAVLSAHSWPGNVRELKSTVERAALLARTRVIELNDLGLATSDGDPSASAVRRTSIPGRGDASSASSAESDVDGNADPVDERERIMRALEDCGGNQSRAAKQLGMSRRTLVRKIAQHGLPRPREK